MYAFITLVLLGLSNDLYLDVTKKFLSGHWIWLDGGNINISLKTSVIYSKRDLFRYVLRTWKDYPSCFKFDCGT